MDIRTETYAVRVNKMRHVRPFTRTETSEAIQRLLEPGLDAIGFTRHAREQARKRNFSQRDVEHVLRTGSVGKPAWDERFGNWTYRVSGSDLDGDDLTVVVALDTERPRITIITGF